MSPTLEVGQRVLIDKATYRFRSPRVGEIVAFHAPDSEILTVKRVVGVGGDKVAIRDGVLYVDGAAVHEPYVDHSLVDSVYFGPVFVPQGTVFLMGDNRGESIDSRSFGPVSLSDVVGRVIPLWSP
jgi:signal peptidase I